MWSLCRKVFEGAFHYLVNEIDKYKNIECNNADKINYLTEII
jgi:hypothetical protein